MAKSEPGIGKAEMEVLRVLWEHGPGVIREVVERLSSRKRPWAYTTVQTMLNRLEAKGYVASDRDASPTSYRASVTRELLMKRRLGGLIDELCDGAALPVVAALVKDKRFCAEDIARFRELLDKVDQDRRKK
jgi:predicted transcriptional regulator